MCEADWLASGDPAAMLSHFSATSTVAHHRPPGPRKMRLWIAAAWRLVAAQRDSGYHCEEGGRKLDLLLRKLSRMAEEGADPCTWHVTTLPDVRHAAARVADHLDPENWARAADLLRDVAGNPFRPFVLPKVVGRPVGILAAASPGLPGLRPGAIVCMSRCPWLTRDVLAVARACYGDWWVGDGVLDGVRLRVLSDCLEDAGCDSDELLAHLRSGGPHVRGCWALDVLLGKP